MAVFSRLEGLGIKNIAPGELYDQDKRMMDKATGVPGIDIVDVLDETAYIFEKKFKCPICDRPFTSLTTRTGKFRPTGTDVDLRPMYEGPDPVKYEIIACPSCGHAAHSRIFGQLAAVQGKLIKEGLSYAYRPIKWGTKAYTYEEAKIRYELAMANAIVGRFRNGERAHLCLKMAWLIRGERERFDANDPDYAEKVKESEADEAELLQQALDGFVDAKQTELPPIAGMDSGTLDYLLSALFYKTGQLEECRKLVGKIMTDRSISNPRIKDRADRLRDIVREEMGGEG